VRDLVCCAGGFIGHHLVKRLVADGHDVTGIDLVGPAWERSAAGRFMIGDLRNLDTCRDAMVCADPDRVWMLAADMGGIGFISAHRASVAWNNVRISGNMLQVCATWRAPVRYLYTSSACVYPAAAQEHAAVVPLREETAWPADPEPGYGLEKLFSEKLCEYYWRDAALRATVVRLHNVYGPLGTWTGGREKAPAAICRKVAESRADGDGGAIDLWGDGQQTRSFMFIDDCVEGLIRLMAAGVDGPINLGTEELVTVAELAHTVKIVAGKSPSLRFDLTRPQGVRGRNSDNAMLRRVLDGWEPRTTLAEGLARTYPWIAEQVARAGA
jgi:nucleoside-diphosphate-sugar epimerase